MNPYGSCRGRYHTDRQPGAALQNTAMCPVAPPPDAARAAGPVVAAVGELVHILLVIAAVLLGLAAVALVAYVAYRLRHKNAARAIASPPGMARAARPLPAPQQRAIGEPAVHIHHHWHGVDAEDVAAIIRSQQDGQ